MPVYNSEKYLKKLYLPFYRQMDAVRQLPQTIPEHNIFPSREDGAFFLPVENVKPKEKIFPQ